MTVSLPEIRPPRSTTELRTLHLGLADALDDIRTRLHNATESTPEQAADALVPPGTGAYGARRAVKVAGPINSAMSAAEDALREAADALRVVVSEARRVGVPDGATW